MADGQARRLPGRPRQSGQHVEPSTGGAAPDADPMPRRAIDTFPRPRRTRATRRITAPRITGPSTGGG